jgi:hypothetical protein
LKKSQRNYTNPDIKVEENSILADADVSQHRKKKKRNMKKQCNLTPPKVNNLLEMDSKNIKVNEILDKEFKRML